MWKIYFATVILCLINGYVVGEETKYCANDTDIIDHILFETSMNYNRHKLPATPVVVKIELWVQEVTSVSEMRQTFEIGKCRENSIPKIFKKEYSFLKDLAL